MTTSLEGSAWAVMEIQSSKETTCLPSLSLRKYVIQPVETAVRDVPVLK